MPRIAALLTCHNRRDKTLACLKALYANMLAPDCSIDSYVVDDGSSDGTSAAVAQAYSRVRLIGGDGSLYWNGGMRLAYEEARKGSYAFYLWLNDDTLLLPDAVSRLLATHEDIGRLTGRPAIIVGGTRDALTGATTYGGLVRLGKWRPLKFQLLAPGDSAAACDSMNGNCVLVPRQVAETIGALDRNFVHAMGDIDYGLRARAAGFGVWLAPGFVGTCAHDHSLGGSFGDSTLPLGERLRKITGPKALPLRSWMEFARRHAGPFWIAYWLWPYLRVVLTSVARTVGRS